MKLNILTYTALAFVSLFASCDNIDESDRFIPVEKPVVPIEDVEKILLIQEFTGHDCSNCPKGAAALHQVQEQYPGQVIVVGLHPYGKNGNDPNTRPMFGQNFRSDAAEAMFEIFDPSGFPCAIFNGITKSTEFNTWFNNAADQIPQIANMSISAVCDYDDTTRNLTVDYAVDFTHDISDDKGFGIMVWIMENNIVGFQNNDGTLVFDYVHNHVLRASLNGDNGEIMGNSFKARDSYSGKSVMTLNENWVAENCQVVVYVFNASSYETEQATLADVCSESNNTNL